MNKTIQTIVLATLCLNFSSKAQELTRRTPQLKTAFTGILVSADSGEPLPSAIVKVAGTNQAAITDQTGEFTFVLRSGKHSLIVSYLAHKTKHLVIELPLKAELIIAMEPNDQQLEEVEVVSTGYQKLPKERAAGSFVLIDSALISRKAGANILDRLDGITSGLIFNRGINDGSNQSNISIRGRSTIFADPNPLIVLDNFPYDGDINTINPNDIANISVLKDAAAASIWGVRAGNGVIVITTKKGKKGSRPVLNFNSNLTIGAKPNIYYPQQISSADYINLEKFLFDHGYDDVPLSNAYSAVSPAVALMEKLRNEQLSVGDYQSQINLLKQLDVRKSLEQYFYRKSIAGQYSLSISGGGADQKYFISGGFDHNLGNQLTNNYNRFTLNGNNTYSLFKDKLELFTSLSFSKSKVGSQTSNYTPLTPYDQLVDQYGRALMVVDNSNQKLRASYTDTAGKGKLLDWGYKPLNENQSNRTANLTEFRFLTSLTYQIIAHLKFQVNYQYSKSQNDNSAVHDQNSFYTRDFINRFSSITPEGVLNQVIPPGDIVYTANTNTVSQYGRTQLNYENTIQGLHTINAITGFEVKDYKDNLLTQSFYGYDPSTASNVNGSINPTNFYKTYYNPYGYETIPTAPGQAGNVDRSLSYYANIGYSYSNKYIFTASARKDETNIFGVKSNQKGVPLWSAGLAWNLSNENFYHCAAFPYLKLRTTYGYNGNSDKSTSAYLTVGIAGGNLWNTQYSQVINPPNPSLRWERIKNINFGLDFSAKNNWLSGSIDYYIKSGMDLIGNSPIAPQTGVSMFKGNTANTKTTGVDVAANFSVINKLGFRWGINVLYNHSTDKITGYELNQPINGSLIGSNYSNPLVGYPYAAIFAFRSAGLDVSGNPRGYLNSEISTDYSGIYNSTDIKSLVFKGSATPTSFGSVRNTISVRQWELSFNITYKLGYYFRRTNVFSGSVYTYQQSDYDKRWQHAGDELHTTVPSLIYPADSFRDAFYSSSDDVVERGDHIRFQDIRLNYQVKQTTGSGGAFKNLQLYGYINNIGVLWRANKKGIDPDAGSQSLPAPRTVSIGLTANF